ncbi:MAG: phosphomannomutase/phosphoglucomutase [bacterium]
MQINKKIFKAYDIRGIYPTEINEENFKIIIASIYDFLKKDLKKEILTIALGRDMRISAPSLFKVAKSTLERRGASIIDIGLVSTPTFYYAVKKYGYDAGIQISASHNPKDYTGLKIVKRVGEKIVKIGQPTGMEEIKQNAISGNILEENKKGELTINETVLKNEVKDIIEEQGVQEIKNLKVAADPANAMGALYLDELFKHLPCELVKINFELDGTFPSHQPDPLQFDTLKDLQKKVIDEKANLGIAPDGDGDRVFFIDEKGEIIPATLITSLIANEILTNNSQEKIIVDIRYTNNVKSVCKKNNAKLLISKVGHALITQQLNKENAAFAGESSGHFYFRQSGGAESSLRVILMLLKIISRGNKTISQILEKYKASIESGEINFVLDESIDSKAVLKSFEELFSKGSISRLDGVAIDFDDWRLSLRTSNTEPLIRLNVEADTKEILDKNLKTILNKMSEFKAKRK